MTKKKKRTKTFTIIASLLIVLIVWIAWGNKALELNSYTIKSDKLPNSFDGFRIAHISDFHNTEIGKDNQRLIAMLKDAKPNIIVITGDMIDSRKTDINVALNFAKEAVKIAPCYYVMGNHEVRIKEYNDFKNGLVELGVVVLSDECVEIELLGEAITIIGVNDPSLKGDNFTSSEKEIMESKLEMLTSEEDGFTILLSHRPELFDTYVKSGVDLVFTGHAHGGQFRLPFVGGVIAPKQGYFPKYDSGIHSEKNTNMVISRGIGNSIIPFRVNNRPEVILITLSAQA